MSVKFVEFLGASGGMVYVNADCIDSFSVGTPQRAESGVFFDRVHVYLKEGANVFGREREESFETFYVEECLPGKLRDLQTRAPVL
jgi:hypothetical protein